jgi:hypothetical protein
LLDFYEAAYLNIACFAVNHAVLSALNTTSISEILFIITLVALSILKHIFYHTNTNDEAKRHYNEKTSDSYTMSSADLNNEKGRQTPTQRIAKQSN